MELVADETDVLCVSCAQEALEAFEIRRICFNLGDGGEVVRVCQDRVELRIGQVVSEWLVLAVSGVQHLKNAVAVSTLSRCILQTATTSVLGHLEMDVALKSQGVAGVGQCRVLLECGCRRGRRRCPVVVCLEHIVGTVQSNREEGGIPNLVEDEHVRFVD